MQAGRVTCHRLNFQIAQAERGGPHDAGVAVVCPPRLVLVALAVGAQLRGNVIRMLAAEGVDAGDIVVQRFADMRYLGQEHTVKVPLPGGEVLSHAAFHDRAGRLAGALVAAGLAPGDRLAAQVDDVALSGPLTSADDLLAALAETIAAGTAGEVSEREAGPAVVEAAELKLVARPEEPEPAVQEAVLATHPMFVYAITADYNGYVPTHNDRFCRPLTGDCQVDLTGNRTKRIFSDRVGQQVGRHTRRSRLQTYRRDTGELMFDMSAPVSVNQRHWGGFRIGYRIE